MGGALVLLLAAGSPSWAGLPDAAWSSAFPIPLPGLPAVRPPVPSLPAFAALPPVPVVVFKGLSIKGVQFSRTERIPESLVAAIDRTEKTLLLSLYDLRLTAVADALLRAKARGVDVRLVYDESHTTPAAPNAGSGPSPEYQSLLAGGVPVRILKGGGSFGIMHNKFAVFDGELLATGSFNWTDAADQKNFENAIFRSDAALAAGFTQYWTWMWGLAHDPAAANAAAGPAGAGLGAPPADALKPVAFAGGNYPRYAFSPEGGVEDLLVDALGRSKRTIDVAIFSLYSQRVADALIAAKARGVVVRVVSDISQSRRSQPVLSLSNAGVGLRLSAGRGGTGVLHHKFAIVDGAWLMTGSYNFSQNAELYNFENDLFTVTPGEVAAYGGEFAAVWEQAHAPAQGELPAPKSL
ncbi:MAG: phospholipase D-like domain-containing protein [Elusimicrobia bacterium]|nr:phospholipase D-like domain-containing protein [Elusimicrobiota bacterium]